MSEFEKSVTQYEKIVKKIIKVDKELEKRKKQLEKRGGIYANKKDVDIEQEYTESTDKVLPSAFVEEQAKIDPLGLSDDKKEDLGDKIYEEKIKTDIENKKQSTTESIISTDKVLPSAFRKKQSKQDALGLSGGRKEEASEKISGEKIKAVVEDKKQSITESIMSALGIKVGEKRKDATKSSLVGGEGAPIQKDNVFKSLVKKVDGLEQKQETFAKLFSKGQSLVSGTANLTPTGIIQSVTSLGRAHPIIAAVITVTTALVIGHLAQFEAGGTRDIRKKRKAEDESLIGIDNENVIANGEILFFSNPSSLQGMPRGQSNTIQLRDGIARYEQRHQGSYNF